MTNRWVLHDYLQVNGGAERLVIRLTKGLPGFRLGLAGIYPGFVESGDLMGLTPQIMSNWFRLLPRIPRALLTFNYLRFAKESQCVIYSGLYAPLAARSQIRGRRLLYCHTPPRFAFDLEQQYLDTVNGLFRPALRWLISLYRCAYLDALKKMDVVVTNSHHVQQRMLFLTGIKSTVIYPPTDLERFRWMGQGNYYLSLGRLEPNKRVDRVVRAFLQMPNKNLVVASGGSQLKALKDLAEGARNIFFTGWLDESAMATWIGYAIACIYIPKDEDFGMSVIEALSAGKPVIGVDDGGLKESITHLETGVLLSLDPTPQEIAESVFAISPEVSKAMRLACEEKATHFSLPQFLNSMSKLVNLD
jgi:glycosyltransferase involved in cell wall biosynthesis